jgi:hypothetical protein
MSPTSEHHKDPLSDSLNTGDATMQEENPLTAEDESPTVKLNALLEQKPEKIKFSMKEFLSQMSETYDGKQFDLASVFTVSEDTES